MTAAARETHPDPLWAAAREVAAHHEISDRSPVPIACRENIALVPAWIGAVRIEAANPESNAAKAAEWFLDNDYQIQRAIQQIARDMPPDFYARLPALGNRDDAGLPRIFAIAHAFLRISHLQLSLSAAVQFVRAYQEVAPLTIGELWAFPTMLRLACVEILVDGCARLFPGADRPFAPARYVGLLEAFDDTDRVARALANFGVISSIPWKTFFDRTSLVEAVLARDPSGIYPRMDFETRDRYRKRVEQLAAGAGRPEPEVAEQVVASAGSAAAGPPHDHVGHWLIAGGRRDFEALLGYRVPIATAIRRWLMRHPGALYISALSVASAIALTVPSAYLAAAGAGPASWLLGVLLAVIPASVLGITFLHWLVTMSVPPRVLPKLDFENGLPDDCATAVVLPVIIRDRGEVGRILDRLEAHRLADPEPALRFVLLSDHADASSERMPCDEATQEALVEGIRRLNEIHGRDEARPFHLLHRPRLHNPSEGCWMGWERKRGKLEAFNNFVLDGDLSAFSLCEGDIEELRRTRFVVTVDADTVLPPGAVTRLAGTLAHPLNVARFDPQTGGVRSGYTIVQPRVEISPQSGSRSLFARLYAGNTAIDIYTRAVSDVYQDLFGEGIYVGKGIYEVASFQRSLKGRVPENALVSHDLFEGVNGRAALASDIVFYEDFPSSYVEFARRWHRWVRGDWQLLPWLAQRVPGAGGERRVNELSVLDRWKILDNLRRSLVPLSLLMLAIAGWLVLPGSPWIWTALTVAAPGAYLFTDLVTGLARGPRRGAVHGLLANLRDHSGRWALAIIFMVHDATVALDAIVRTSWRLSVSRRRLLEWTSAAHTATAVAGTSPRAAAWGYMWPAPAIAAVTTLLLALAAPLSLLPAAPLLLMWLVCPEVAIFISRQHESPVEEVDADDRAFLRRLARRTWLYFETFVGPTDHWLPPDNYQEEPHPEIAHRTSPTNIGMMFLSTLTAWDLGYVDSTELAARIRNALDTLDRLERFRGHFLNWYDTRLLTPLEPRYVSTVDSGNLAVCLIALKDACEEAAQGPALRPQLWDGLTDALDVLDHSIRRIPDGQDLEFRSHLAAILDRIGDARANVEAAWPDLKDIAERAFPELEEAVGRDIASREAPPAAALHDVQIWLERTRHHLVRMQRDLESLSPWLPLLDAPPEEFASLAHSVASLLAVSIPLTGIGARCAEARAMVAAAMNPEQQSASARWLSELDVALQSGARSQAELSRDFLDIARRLEEMAFAMDFRPLFDADSRLFHIGYNVSADRIDSSRYDLLASEARMASFFAIAKGDVPFEHWFFLGRPITRTAGGLSLISWNGSMFEYLMPSLLLRSTPGTLLAQSERTAVDAQRRYAERQATPWGISESAFASQDPDHHYRYRSFGVSDLGLRRDLARDLVIAPYASALALPVRTRMAVDNLRHLEDLGLMGTYGFYDAADYTPERVPPGRKFAPVHNYMAHHQGMTLSALDNALMDGILVRRFNAHPNVRAIELLVQERVPWELPPEIRPTEERELQPRRAVAAPHPWSVPQAAAFPQLHALGNGRLSSWISAAGGGALTWRHHALTRWLPDPTRDNSGLWIYVRDEDDGTLWSVGRQPTGVSPPESRVVFHPHMAELHQRHHGIGVRMEVGVAPSDDVEIRRITLANESDSPRRLRLASYGEPVLAPATDDERHYAFSKLFVGSEHLADLDGLLFTRRPRSPGGAPPVLLHRVVSEEPLVEVIGVETDRRRFLGRNGDMARPRAMLEGLSGTLGWTLDPVMSLEVRVELEPHERRQFAFLTMAAASRSSVLELAERYATLATLEWALNDAAVDAAREARQLHLEPARLPELQALMSLLAYRHPALRASGDAIKSNLLGQPRLWGLGISGDNPILLVHAGDPEETELLRILIAGHQMWRRRGVHIDLVMVRAGMSGYVEPLREELMSLLHEAGAQELLGRNGGIHLVLGDQVREEDRRLLEATAGVILDTGRGTLAAQLERAGATRSLPPPFEPTGAPEEPEATADIPRAVGLGFDNGIGGFSADGREYVIHLEPGEVTPAPWCNVLANETFGTIVTESGGGFTWAVNSGENRLTPWTNDPVADPPAETVYLRDEESAEIWTLTPRPAGSHSACEIRHGAGYSKWRRRSQGLDQELLVFVAPDDPVKIARLKITNLEARPRRVTATYYAEWLLGALRGIARPCVVCEYDPTCHALMARNSWNPDFAERVAFLTSNLPPHSLTTDRHDFLGPHGDPARPAAMFRWDLGGRTTPGGDPCAAFQVHLDIAANEVVEAVFVLGQGENRKKAEELARQWQDVARADKALEEVARIWDRRLGAVQVRTPDPAFDTIVNRWLPYQTISSRVLARAGFYQAGGAFGFRDQLQDVMALFLIEPARARAHILAAAARQFEEGDVLHWWHPPNDRGVRTRCSDDLLWLPYVTACYVEATGDETILNEEIPFLQAPPLSPNEHDRYARFDSVSRPQTLFDHCERAVDYGVTQGAHGLPLMGTGDWNDGMDRVGDKGHGESVWLAWFAVATMDRFAGLARRMKRASLARRWTTRARRLEKAIDAAAWDGGWYLRAFDDDGAALGTAHAQECRIDSISQSWSVLAPHSISQRARTALASAEHELCDREHRLVRLLWPPFDATPRDPGYIKAYPPGIRENGGQYSHATAWLGHAFAYLGDGDAAARIFACLNPIPHASTRQEAERYLVEPYALAADIGGVAPHEGRGGWTWYTGAAAWTWRLGIEAMLGLRPKDGGLVIDPCLPKDWGGFEVDIKGPKGNLSIRVEDPDHIGRGDIEVKIAGKRSKQAIVGFPTDGSVRRVEVKLRAPREKARQ